MRTAALCRWISCRWTIERGRASYPLGTLGAGEFGRCPRDRGPACSRDRSRWGWEEALGRSLVIEPTNDEAVPHMRDPVPNSIVRGQCLNPPLGAEMFLDKLADHIQLRIAMDRVSFREFHPIDAHSILLQNRHLLSHLGARDQRIQGAMSK